MGFQQEDRVFTSTDKKQLFIPCGCGDFADSIRISADEDWLEGEEFGFLSVDLLGPHRFFRRLKYLWRFLRTREFHADTIISPVTARHLHAWLTYMIDLWDAKSIEKKNLENENPENIPGA